VRIGTASSLAAIAIELALLGLTGFFRTVEGLKAPANGKEPLSTEVLYWLWFISF